MDSNLLLVFLCSLAGIGAAVWIGALLLLHFWQHEHPVSTTKVERPPVGSQTS